MIKLLFMRGADCRVSAALLDFTKNACACLCRSSCLACHVVDLGIAPRYNAHDMGYESAYVHRFTIFVQ